MHTNTIVVVFVVVVFNLSERPDFPLDNGIIG